MAKKLIRLYEQDTTDFSNNGLKILNPTSAKITRNLIEYTYQLELTHLLDEKGMMLTEERILGYNGQYFRISSIRRNLKEVSVIAKHIFFDLNKNFIEDINIKNKTGSMALAHILGGTSYPHSFSATSDIDTVASSRLVRKNVVSALIGDTDNSFINRWGGELDIDGFTFKLNKQIGKDDGYTIQYGKNLTGLDLQLNMLEVVTRIRPVGFDGIEIDGLYVDSPYIDNYALPIIKEIKYENVKWKGSPNYEEREDDDSYIYDNLAEAQAKLIELATNEFVVNEIDLPKTTINIEFIELSKIEEYKHLKFLQNINIGDTVHIYHKPLEINLKSRCIEYVYDCILNKYETITLGSYTKNFFTKTQNTNTTVDSGNLDIKFSGMVNDILQQTQKHLNDTITSAMGGYVYKTNNALYIMDTDDISTAQKIWVWNKNGLAFSSNGVNGPYTTGITMDGYIVGSMISANSIVGEQIQANSIKTTNLELSVQKKIESATDKETVKALIKADLDGFESTLSKEFVTVENATTQIQQATEVAVKEATQNIIDNAISESMGAVDGQLNDKLNQYTGNTLLPAINEKAEEVLQSAEDYVITQLENYTTKQELSSSISQTREQIELSVSEKYTTKTESATIITEAIDGITVGAINRVFGTGENKSFKFNGGANETWLPYKFSNDISDKEVFVSFKYTLTGTAQNGSQIEFAPSYLKKTNNQTVYRPKHIFFTSSRLQDVNIADTVSFTTKDFQDISPSSTSYIRFVGNGFTGTLSISEVQIKPGNSKTTWSPAPEDTISDINDAKNEAINAANGTLIATISNYYTKSETDSKISVAKDEINLGVSSTYETKANVETMVTSTLNSAKSYSDTKKTEAINAANNTLTTTIANYYTKTETDSNINIAKNAVTTSVSTLRNEVMSATYTNLLENSDFLILDNDFPRGYSSYTYGDSEVRISSWVLEGAKAVKITSSGKTAYHWISLFSPFVKTIEGQQFTASAWVATSSISSIDDGCVIEIEWYNDADRITTTSYVFTPKTDNTWERVAVTGWSPSGTTRARVRISVRKNGVLYATKLMLQAGGTATAWTRGGDFETITDRISYAEQKITDESITNTVKKNFYTKEETNNAITSKGYATESQLQQTANNITSTVSQNYYTKQETENTINNKNFATKSEVQQTANNITYKFSQSGGYNLVRNGNPKPWHEENWWVSGNGWWYRKNSNDLGIQTIDSNEAYAGSATFKINGGSNYSFSCWLFAEANTKGADVYFIGSSKDDGSYEDVHHLFNGGKDGWTKVEATFTPNTNTKYGFIRIDNNGIIDASAGYNVVFFSEVQLVQGWECYPQWSPNPNETYDGITTIDKDGIKVTASNINGYTHMTNGGFCLNKSGTDVFKVDSGGLSMRGYGSNSGRYIKIENEDYTVWNNNINCLRFGYKNWNGWDGVPEFLMGYKGFRYSETANTGEDASYFGMQTWGRWVRNNPNAYHEIYYRSDKFGDTSYIRFDEDGTVDYRSLGQTVIKHSASGHGIALAKYSGKDLSYVRPTLHNATDLGHESYRYRTIYATNGSINTSDISLKENINPIVSKAETPTLLLDEAKAALSAEDYYEFVKTLPMYTYDYKSKDDEENRALHNVGFIAQDVADTPVGNEFIFKGEDGVYQYNMQGYVGVLAVALQNSIKENESLKERVNDLEERLNKLEALLSSQ